MLIKLIIAIPAGLLLFASFWAYDRYTSYQGGIFPTPYEFSSNTDQIAVDAAILITGDRMALHLARFKENLALEVSQGLSKPIKIDVLAQDYDAIHRTLEKTENLSKWPKLIIYTGGSTELFEERFLKSQISKVRTNIARYQDDKWRTLLMVWPTFARFLYEPLQRAKLPSEFILDEKEISEVEYQARLELNYQLYEILLNRFVEVARENKQNIILMTVPVNLDIEPRKTCSLSYTDKVKKEIEEVKALIKNQDYKSAYPKSQDLTLATLANAEVFWLHGRVAKQLGQKIEAKENLKKAAAFDCKFWRANEVTNNIIRKVAQEQRVTLYDFAEVVEGQWTLNTTFFDDIYAQNLYYDRAVQTLALAIRKMLKI